MRKFIGITIGPICDTIGEASTPAALWFASSLFSDITKRICEKIHKEYADVTIYSPYYAEDIKMDDGIGKFHDRIIFSVSDFSDEKMKAIIEEVKENTVSVFPQVEEFQNEKAKAFFKEYLQIHYVVKKEEQIDASNCVLALSRYLDSLELMKTFPKDDSENPIRKLFLGEDKNGNKYIKNSVLFNRVTDASNQLKNEEGNIWAVNEIATAHGKLKNSFKRKDYYAVVSADGDGMGKFLEKLSSDRVRDFSKCCLAYAQEAAELIGAYGGMTIYAGGDDLLFLAPIMTDTDDIFRLCNSIQKLFGDKLAGQFNGIEQLPTISFGISIQYRKYPLYEALANASRLLALAKKDGDFANTTAQKNNMMIELQKHSGQSLSLLVANDSYDVWKQILQLGNDLSNEQRTITSVLYVLDNFASLIAVLNQEVEKTGISLESYQNRWSNFFDNVDQTKADAYIKGISEFYYTNLVVGKERILVPEYSLRSNYITVEKDTGIGDKSLLALIYLLKLKQFLKEGEGERNEVSGKNETP